jgi:hypothetical protein
MSDETAPQFRVKTSWLIGTAAAFAIFVVIASYSVRMTWDYTDYDQQRAADRKVTLAKVRQDEGKLLCPVDAKGKPTAEWVDQAKGAIRIPIEEAMVEEIDTLKAQPVQAGGEIPPPPPPVPAKAAPAAKPPAAAPPAAAPPAAAPPSAGATNAAPTAAAKPASAKKPKKPNPSN